MMTSNNTLIMHKPAQALAALQKKKAQLKTREKELKAELETYIASENRKLRLAIGSYMIGHLADPAIRRSLNKVLLGLRPDYRERLSGLMAEAVGSKVAQVQISFAEPAQPATTSLPDEPPPAGSAATSDSGT